MRVCVCVIREEALKYLKRKRGYRLRVRAKCAPTERRKKGEVRRALSFIPLARKTENRAQQQPFRDTRGNEIYRISFDRVRSRITHRVITRRNKDPRDPFRRETKRVVG